MKIGVLTVSDRCSTGECEDKSGPVLCELLKDTFSDCIISTNIVPDEILNIQDIIKNWSADEFDLILTTGGTGFAPRDITPEATKPLLDKECPGIVVAMISSSLQITPMAMLSRPAAGIRNKTLIVNLPGSPKGAKENLQSIISTIPHAISLIQQNKDKNKHS